MVTLKDFENGETAWCAGCGNFQILQAVKQALVNLEIEPYQVVFVSGIGQAAKLPHYLKCNLFNGLHGRTLPVATGIKIVNHELTVLAVGGDGDGYGEGGNHLIHAIRRNIDITYIVHNNQIYGLTKGQASPTSEIGLKTKTTPQGVILKPFNPIAMAISLGATFVARGYSAKTPHLTELIEEGIKHKGFSLIDVLQPCVTFNQLNTYKWYNKRIYDVSAEPGFNPENMIASFEKSLEWGDRIPIGIIHKSKRPSYEEQLSVLGKKILVNQEYAVEKMQKILKEFVP
jgi:2-oxoglutarate ferredoxin oxidoreductase subunit beta